MEQTEINHLTIFTDSSLTGIHGNGTSPFKRSYKK